MILLNFIRRALASFLVDSTFPRGIFKGVLGKKKTPNSRTVIVNKKNWITLIFEYLPWG